MTYDVVPGQVLAVSAATGVLSTATDDEANPITAVLVTGPADGTLVLQADGSFAYTPATGFSGPDAFVYTPADGSVTGDPVTISLLVGGPGSFSLPPYSVIHDQTLTVGADQGVLVDSSAGSTATLATPPAYGSVTLNADGSFVYVPEAGFVGTDAFSFVADDGQDPPLTGTAFINVTDTAPLASSGLAYDVAASTTLSVQATAGVLNGAADPDRDPVSAVLVSGPTHGSLDLGSDGSFSYTPQPGFVGVDSFTFAPSDGLEQGDSATVRLVVTAAPASGLPPYTVPHDQVLSVGAAQGVLASDPNAAAAGNLSVLTDAANGAVDLASDGSFIYTPNPGFVGADSFTWSVGGITGAAQTGTAVVYVTDAAPVASARQVYDVTGTSLTVAATGGVLTGATDADGDAITAVPVSGPSHGTLTLNPDGSFAYTPQAGYQGLDGFTFAPSDGLETGDVVTVDLVVGPAAPVTQSWMMTGDWTVTIGATDGLLAGASNPDGGTLTAALASPAWHGAITVNPDGSFVYTPPAGFVGTDAFSYRVDDGGTWSGPFTAQIVVSDPASPTAPDLAYAAPGALSVDAASGVLSAYGGTATAALQTGPAHGSLALQGDGSFTYTADAGYTGPDTFTFVPTVGTTAGAPVTVALHVGPVVGSGTDTWSLYPGQTLTIDAADGLLAGSAGGDGAGLSVVLVTPPQGDLVLNADGSFTYTPQAGFTGEDTFTFAITDGSSVSNPVTATVDVVDNTPAGEPVTYAVVEGQPLTVDAAAGVLSYAWDAAGDPLTAVLVSGPTNGSLSAFGADGSFTYTADAGFVGTDSFTWYPTNGVLDGVPVTISLQVDQVANLVQVQTASTTFDPGTSAAFTLGNAFANVPAFTQVQWDFAYDGTNFVASVTGTDLSATTTFATAGTYDVAARVTDASGAQTVLTQQVTVGSQPPTVTTQGDLTVNAGATASFQANATFDGTARLASVQWQVSADGEAYQDDPATGLTHSHTFATFGDYDVLVSVTDTNGNTAQSSFHVRVNEDTPLATVQVGPAVTEGQATTFTVTPTDPDQLDALSVFADWDGSGNPDEISQADWVNNGNGSFSFTHVYLAASPAGGYTASILVQDEGGQGTTVPVSVVVNKMPLTGTLVADFQVASAATSGENVWAVAAGPGSANGDPSGAAPTVQFVNITDPDPSRLLYTWTVVDHTDPTGSSAESVKDPEVVQTTTPSFTAPFHDSDTFFTINATIVDPADNNATFSTSIIVVIQPPVAYATNESTGQIVAASSAYPIDPTLNNTFYGLGGTATAFGRLLPDNVAQARDTVVPRAEDSGDTNFYRDLQTLAINQTQPLPNPDGSPGAIPTSPQTLTFVLDPASQAMVAAGATVRYYFAVNVYDCSQANPTTGTGPELLTAETKNFNQTSNVLTLSTQLESDWGHNDRQFVITAFATISGGPNNLAVHETDLYQFSLTTPRTPTLLEYFQSIGTQITGAAQGLLNLAQRFGANATAVFNTIIANPTTFINTLSKALGGAVKQVIGNLTNFSWLSSQLVSWLESKVPALASIQTADLSTTQGMVTFFLQYAGVTQAHVMQVIANAVGPSNVAMISQLMSILGNYNLADPNQLLKLVQDLPGIVAKQLGVPNPSAPDFQSQILNAVTSLIPQVASSAFQQFVAKFVPGGAFISTAVNTLSWILDNQDRLSGVINAFISGLADLADGKSADLQAKLVAAFDQAVPAMLDFAAAQCGLSGLPQKLNQALQLIPTEVDKELKQAVNFLVGKVKSLLRVAPGGATPRAPKVSVQFEGANYLIWAVGTSSGARIMCSQAVSTATNFLDAKVVQNNTTLTGDLNSAISAAQKLLTAASTLKLDPSGTVPALAGEQQALLGVLTTFAADLVKNPCGILKLGACFAAGTKVLTPLGWWPVEELYEGMLVRSRPEDDPHAETRWNAVEVNSCRRGGCCTCTSAAR